MKRNIKVISINGIRGLVLALFVVFCLFCGFIITPSICCEYLWNWVGNNFVVLPQMTFLHGALLWSIIALTVYALCKGRINIGSVTQTAPTENDIKTILEQVKENTPQVSNIEITKNETADKEIEKVEK